jgi:hypothetical protein
MLVILRGFLATVLVADVDFDASHSIAKMA